MDELTIHPFWLGVISMAFSALIGAVWWMLNRRIQKLEDWKVDKGFCKTNNKLLQEKFAGIHGRINDWKEDNAKDHRRMEGTLRDIDSGLQVHGNMLADVKECLVKIANNKEC